MNLDMFDRETEDAPTAGARAGSGPTPAVSIIVPAFNPGAFLREALQSVVAQTFADWELILIDDGSTEDLRPQIPSDARIRVFHQPNRGLSAARNAGIMRAGAALVAFLDADDVWTTDKLARQVDALAVRPDAVLCHAQMRFIDERGRHGGLGWGGQYETYADLMDGCGVCVSSVVIRRPVLFACGLFDPLLYGTQDYDLWLKAARLGPMAAIAEPLVLYRQHGSNMSRQYVRMSAEISAILRRHRELARSTGNADGVRRCGRGLRRTRRNLALQALAAATSAAKAHRAADLFRHLALGMWNAPLSFSPRVLATAARAASSAAPWHARAADR